MTLRVRTKVASGFGGELIWNRIEIVGLFNLRGTDIEANPVFFSYAILTPNELHLYIMNKERINYDIENHFYVEGIEVLTKEYNTTLAGINSVVKTHLKNHRIAFSMFELPNFH